MRAIVAREYGPPETLKLEVWPDPPAPGPGQITVEHSAWGLNYVDMLMIAGGYQHKPNIPFIPGLEAAGTVVAVGAGAEEYAVGDPVITHQRDGAYAEMVTVSTENAVPAPIGYSLAEAAAFRSVFQTAYHALVQAGRLAAGETVLVHGAAGGTGHATVQVAKAMGAKVIATAGGPDKCAAVKNFGADHVIDHQATPAWKDTVKDLTDGKGADVIFDPVGGNVFDQSTRCLNIGARLLIIGFTGGRPALAKTNHLLIKEASAIGVRAGGFTRRHPGMARSNYDALREMAEAGKIKPHLHHTAPFDKVADAMELIAGRAVIGKVVLAD
jgi:NADPH2:quinone reductase